MAIKASAKGAAAEKEKRLLLKQGRGLKEIKLWSDW